MPTPSVPLSQAFATAMERLGPFEPMPNIALAVSGGADSMALAILARDWVRQYGGSVLALVVDHALRPSSLSEAHLTIHRLGDAGVPARLLTLTGLLPGSALAERARVMRYRALGDACRQAGILHLLLGHHAADQMETLAMRVLRSSQTHGLGGMSAVVETAHVRLLRPLLPMAPSLLRNFLTTQGLAWVEDPSNQDMRALRSRLRRSLTIAAGTETDLSSAIAAVGALRAREEAEAARELAGRACIRPEGFAKLSPGPIGEVALRSLIRAISGARYLPSSTQISGLAANPQPATVAGVRIMPAGRMGDGMLIAREEAAIAAPVPALEGAMWDNRFRLTGGITLPADATIEALGADAARFRRATSLPSAVLRTLPAIRVGKVLAAVPHLGYGCLENDRRMIALFSPARPAAGANFVPAL